MKMKKLLYIGLGLFLMSCLPQGSSDESCEGEGKYFDQSTKECVTVSSVSQKTSLSEKVQLTSDYGCVARSNGLYCWKGDEKPLQVLPNLINGIKKFKMLTFRDTNFKNEDGKITDELASLLILSTDNTLFIINLRRSPEAEEKTGNGDVIECLKTPNPAQCLAGSENVPSTPEPTQTSSEGSSEEETSPTQPPAYCDEESRIFGHCGSAGSWERASIFDVEDFKIHGLTTCAHMENKSIKCWGDNRSYQTGIKEGYGVYKDVVLFNSDDEDGTVLGSRKDIRKFNSFKMFGEKRKDGGYNTGVCGLNVRGHLYCWGHVEGKETIDIVNASRKVDDTVHRVRLFKGDGKTDFVVTDYIISPKGHVMYALGRKGDESKRRWFAFGSEDGEGLGTEGIHELPIRMVDHKGKEEDISNIREIYVTGGDTHCLRTDEDLLRCAFQGKTPNNFLKRDESWFTAFGDKNDKITDFYVIGKDKDEYCFILEKDSTLQCSFDIEFENTTGVVEFKSHKDTFCILNEKEELHCQKEDEASSITDIDMKGFYIGGEEDNEFVLAHAKDGRFYGWGEDDSDDEHPAFNGQVGGADDGFGDINKKDESVTSTTDDDDLDELGFLYLDQVFTGHHNHVVGRSGNLYYRWGRIGLQDNDKVTVEATKGHGGDGEELEF